MTTCNLAPNQGEAVGSSSEVVSMHWHIPLSAVGIVMERTGGGGWAKWILRWFLALRFFALTLLSSQYPREGGCMDPGDEISMPHFINFMAAPWSICGPSFPSRDQTCTPCVGSTVLTTGPPGKSHHSHFRGWRRKAQGMKLKKGKSLGHVRLSATPWTGGSSVRWTFQARIPEWVAISFSRGSSRPRDRTQLSHIAGRHFTIWATRASRGSA